MPKSSRKTTDNRNTTDLSRLIRVVEIVLAICLAIAAIAFYLVFLYFSPVAGPCEGYVTDHAPSGVWNSYCRDDGPGR